MMANNQKWHYQWMNLVLFATPMLWILFWVNLIGTVYGYMWYWGQLTETFETMNRLLLPFVPDSPTASLFFALSLLFMIADRHELWRLRVQAVKGLRGLIDALAVITLVKYGVWAVVMNIADGYQGGGIDWQQWMLIGSHAGMALQAILYARLMKFGKLSIAAAALWTVTNDILDYSLDIHPWLYAPLEDDIPTIRTFTYTLSLICISLAIMLQMQNARTRNDSKLA